MRTTRSSSETTSVSGLDWALVTLELFVAVGAFGGSLGLINGTIDAQSYVDDLPWRSTTFGGVALALIVAVPCAAAAITTLVRHRWAPWPHVVAGGLLMGWIVVQVAFIGLLSWLQPFMFVCGLAMVVLGLMGERRAQPSGAVRTMVTGHGA